MTASFAFMAKRIVSLSTSGAGPAIPKRDIVDREPGIQHAGDQRRDRLRESAVRALGDAHGRSADRGAGHRVLDAGFAVDNIAFGMGGGLLQKVDRDTMRFAMKATRRSSTAVRPAGLQGSGE